MLGIVILLGVSQVCGGGGALGVGFEKLRGGYLEGIRSNVLC